MWTGQAGRILVPQTLREFAGLEKDVVLTGNLNRIEVWSKEKWSENCDYDDMDSIAESMQDMGIIIWAYAGKKSNRRRIWNLNINLYYWKKPLTAWISNRTESTWMELWEEQGTQVKCAETFCQGEIYWHRSGPRCNNCCEWQVGRLWGQGDDHSQQLLLHG